MAKPRFIVAHVEFKPGSAFRPLVPYHEGDWEINGIFPKDDTHVTVIWVEKVTPSGFRRPLPHTLLSPQKDASGWPEKDV